MQNHIKNKLYLSGELGLTYFFFFNWDSHLTKALPLSTSFNEVLLANSISSLVISR